MRQLSITCFEGLNGQWVLYGSLRCFEDNKSHTTTQVYRGEHEQIDDEDPEFVALQLLNRMCADLEVEYRH